MSMADLWNRTLVYFGIAEEDEYWDEDGYITEEELERSYADRPNVRRLNPRGRRAGSDDWTEVDAEPEPSQQAPTGRRRPRTLEALPGAPPAQVHLVVPRSFNDAQQIADKFKQAMPVIVNLQGTDQELSKRLIDFTSGLTYALNGGMQRVADKVFLLTPRNVELSAAEKARWLESGAFYNQS